MKRLFYFLLIFLISFSGYAQEEAYKSLQQSVEGITLDWKSTVFIGLDYNWVITHFGIYLQLNRSLAEKSTHFGNTEITQVYVPNVSTGDEQIKIVYHIKQDPDLPGAYEGTEGPVNIITGVDMTGSTKILTELFVNYWPDRLKLGDERPEGNAVAYKRLLNDYISLHKLSNTEAQIKIETYNLHIDYQKNYGINIKKS